MTTLTEQLRALWTEKGRPPSRTLARRTSGQLTHTTVANVLGGKRATRWSSLVQVVQALGGNPADFRVAWEREWDAHETTRHTKAGRSRVRVVAGLVARPGDTLVFTVPEVQDKERLMDLHQHLRDRFPNNPVQLVAGAQATVIRREEAA